MKIEIKQLLEKYFNGETTLEEENLLREYAMNNPDAGINDDFAALFNWSAKNNQEHLPDNFSDRLLEKIKSNDTKVKPVTTISKKFFWLYAAASVLILAILTLVLTHNFRGVNSTDEEIALTDTYANPDEALREIRKSLYLVSSKLNEGVNFFEVKTKKLK